LFCFVSPNKNNISPREGFDLVTWGFVLSESKANKRRREKWGGLLDKFFFEMVVEFFFVLKSPGTATTSK